MTTAATTVIEGLQTRLKVGMEIHVELATRTKMWTSAPNVAHPDYFEAEPNSLVDPVVMGLPGTLPVMNRRAVEMSIRVGLALGCRIAEWCKWDRKSYYYPDLPKNYQISQYDLPLCGEGCIQVPINDEPDAPQRPIRIIRAHLEEDAGKLLHEAPGGRKIDYSIVDLNRAGTPLLEIVTRPDITTADQAVMFGQTLRNICRFLGVSECNMQRGHIRFEPNINVIIEKNGETYATPIVEVKNLNSFKAVYGAIQYEHRRQVQAWLADGKVMSAGSKQTRGWDDVAMETFLQREKEDAHDYRYFPDPDLAPVTVSAELLQRIGATVPELPLQRQRRYCREYGLSVKEARTLTEEREICLFYEAVIQAGVEGKRAATILLNNLAKRANERGVMIHQLAITPAQVKTIESMAAGNKIGSASADQLYGLCCELGAAADPESLAKEKGMIQVSDEGALEGWIDAAIAANAKAVEQFKQGKDAAINSLLGFVMKQSKGQANAKLVMEKLRKKISG